MYTQQDFLRDLERDHTLCVEISRKKNSDYAGVSDPFKNFRNCETYGVSAEKGIIVRMTDKLTRASNLLEREALVADEKIGDTLLDLANYSIILKLMLENKKRTNHVEIKGDPDEYRDNEEGR